MHATYRHSHTGYATGCPQDLFLRETCYSVLPTRWKPAPRHKDQIISGHFGLFYFLDLPGLRAMCGGNKVTVKRTSLGPPGSPHMGTWRPSHGHQACMVCPAVGWKQGWWAFTRLAF